MKFPYCLTIVSVGKATTPDRTQEPEDEETRLISEANAEFTNENYDKYLELLKKYEDIVGDSTVLRHNRAVGRFYKTNCKDHVTLLKELDSLDKDEADETAATLRTIPFNPLLKYNKAVIYFNRHMYETAIETLSPLVDKLKFLEKDIAFIVGILMLRLLLETNQLNKAQAFLDFLEIQLQIGSRALTTDKESVCESGKMEPEAQRAFKWLNMLTNILNRKIVVIPDDEAPEFAALKAHQYYIMKDFQMSAKQLEKINADQKNIRSEIRTCIANNMGIIHLRVRHYAIAAKFFQNAIAFDRTVATNMHNVTLEQMSVVRTREILYNLGLAMLYLRRPSEAFQCFLAPLKSYHNNPRLWFRIAEACIMQYDMKRQSLEKYTINFTLKPNLRSVYTSKLQISNTLPEPSLEFAAISLRNALTLATCYKKCFHEPSINNSSSDGMNWQNVKDNVCNPSTPITRESLNELLTAIYAAYSFVSLRLGDYVMALEMAQELIKMEKLSDAYKLLAHMYAGEANLMMDKFSEARPYMEPPFVTTMNAFDFETKDWEVKSVEIAQSIVRYNLAVALVMQGNVELAQPYINTCTHPIVASKIVALKMYISSLIDKVGPHLNYC